MRNLAEVKAMNYNILFTLTMLANSGNATHSEADYFAGVLDALTWIIESSQHGQDLPNKLHEVNRGT